MDVLDLSALIKQVAKAFDVPIFQVEDALNEEPHASIVAAFCRAGGPSRCLVCMQPADDGADAACLVGVASTSASADETGYPDLVLLHAEARARAGPGEAESRASPELSSSCSSSPASMASDSSGRRSRTCKRRSR